MAEDDGSSANENDLAVAAPVAALAVAPNPAVRPTAATTALAAATAPAFAAADARMLWIGSRMLFMARSLLLLRRLRAALWLTAPAVAVPGSRWAGVRTMASLGFNPVRKSR
jgi:hypothetical protein